MFVKCLSIRIAQAQPKCYTPLSKPQKSVSATGRHTLKVKVENLGFQHDILQNVSACWRFHVSFIKTMNDTYIQFMETRRKKYIEADTVLAGSNIEELWQHIPKISREISMLVCIHVDTGKVGKLLTHSKIMGQKSGVLAYS